MPEIMMTSEQNDCSVCAVINALAQLNVEAEREKVKKAVRYTSTGGHSHIGLQVMAEQYGLEWERYPKYVDLIHTPIDEYISRTLPKDNAKILLGEYIKRLKDGEKAVTTIWINPEISHSIALIGEKDGKLIVACSLMGVYEAGEELFFSPIGQLQAGWLTCWVVRGDWKG